MWRTWTLHLKRLVLFFEFRTQVGDVPSCEALPASLFVA